MLSAVANNPKAFAKKKLAYKIVRCTRNKQISTHGNMDRKTYPQPRVAPVGLLPVGNDRHVRPVAFSAELRLLEKVAELASEVHCQHIPAVGPYSSLGNPDVYRHICHIGSTSPETASLHYVVD